MSEFEEFINFGAAILEIDRLEQENNELKGEIKNLEEVALHALSLVNILSLSILNKEYSE